MSKPKYIQANYTKTIEFDLEELGIDWDKVDYFSIIHSELVVNYTDGTTQTFQFTTEHEIDWKRANSEAVLDEYYLTLSVEVNE
tara:strand:+ start:39 stop:290 length:252 start_codon:yes stop_codon:yes gene_type:complete